MSSFNYSSVNRLDYDFDLGFKWSNEYESTEYRE